MNLFFPAKLKFLDWFNKKKDWAKYAKYQPFFIFHTIFQKNRQRQPTDCINCGFWAICCIACWKKGDCVILAVSCGFDCICWNMLWIPGAAAGLVVEPEEVVELWLALLLNKLEGECELKLLWLCISVHNISTFSISWHVCSTGKNKIIFLFSRMSVFN